MELMKVQSQLDLREHELIEMYDQQSNQTARQARLRTQDGNKMAKTMESESVTTENERPTKRAKVFCGVENCLGGRSAAACSPFLAECDVFKNHCERLML